VKRSRGGPTDSRPVVESARASTLRCRPRRSPSTEPPPTGNRPCCSRQGSLTGFSGPRLHYRDLQRMFDARARPRAGNPPPREAVASVRVRLPRRLPAERSRRRLLAQRVPDERLTSFSPSRCFAAGGSCVRRAGAANEGREVTPRSHAFCRPSPRPPRGGVAACAARTVRSMAPASVEGGSPQHCCSGQHGPSAAERRARDPESRDRCAVPVPEGFRAPLLDACARAPSVVVAWATPGLEPGITRRRRPRLPALPCSREGARLQYSQGAWVAS
jgi:hypothetical protein